MEIILWKSEVAVCAGNVPKKEFVEERCSPVPNYVEACQKFTKSFHGILFLFAKPSAVLAISDSDVHCCDSSALSIFMEPLFASVLEVIATVSISFLIAFIILIPAFLPDCGIRS
jgi:hypothetical protein